MILNNISDAKYGNRQVSKIYLGEKLIWPILWSPLNFKRNLLIWLDASDNSTLVLLGNSVSKWMDKSGNGRDAVQSDPNRRPSFSINGFNSRPTIQNGSLVNSNALTWNGDAINPTKVFVVAQYDGPNPFNSLGSICAFDFTGSADIPYFHPQSGIRWAGTPLRFLNGSEDGANVFTGPAALPTISSPFLAHSGPPYPNNGRTSFTVCGEREKTVSGDPLLNRGWRGRVCEIFVLSGDISNKDIKKSEGYLAHKWGVSANLPLSHPYKFFPPKQ